MKEKQVSLILADEHLRSTFAENYCGHLKYYQRGIIHTQNECLNKFIHGLDQVTGYVPKSGK